MAKLIDADKINYHEHTECMGHGDFETVRTVTDKEIAEILTVDAVEVIRCRDCKFGTHFGDMEDEWVNCMNLYGKPLMPFDGFCSYGERKDGDGNG